MSLLRESPVAARPVEPAPRARRWTRLGPAIREVLLVAALFLAYKLGRLVADGHVTEAMANARAVWDLERLAHLPNEYALQHAALGQPWLVRLANCYYAYVHFPATAIFLIWMYLRRPAFYRWARRALASLTGAALALHLLTPLAPPRMLAEFGMVDTGRLYGPAVYGPPKTDTLANQYAAMPSLHVGWALAVAVTLIVVTRSRWRWLWLAHPIVTLLVVVATGNHYLLDAIAATMLLAAILLLLPPPGAPRARPVPRQASGRALDADRVGAGRPGADRLGVNRLRVNGLSRCLAGGSRPARPRPAPPRRRRARPPASP